jgi:hypothetical protein
MGLVVYMCENHLMAAMLDCHKSHQSTARHPMYCADTTHAANTCMPQYDECLLDSTCLGLLRQDVGDIEGVEENDDKLYIPACDASAPCVAWRTCSRPRDRYGAPPPPAAPSSGSTGMIVGAVVAAVGLVGILLATTAKKK